MAGICPLRFDPGADKHHPRGPGLPVILWEVNPVLRARYTDKEHSGGGVHLSDFKEDLAVPEEQSCDGAAHPALALLGQSLPKGSCWLMPLWLGVGYRQAAAVRFPAHTWLSDGEG